MLPIGESLMRAVGTRPLACPSVDS